MTLTEGSDRVNEELSSQFDFESIDNGILVINKIINDSSQDNYHKKETIARCIQNIMSGYEKNYNFIRIHAR
jgi:hypothetical protein